MATISKYETSNGARYRVRYRKPDGRQTDKRGFTRKRDAEAFAATVEVSKLTHTYIDPTSAAVTVGALYPSWEALKARLKPSYRATLTGTWETHVKPTWEHVQVGKIRPSQVQAWLNSIDRSPSVVRRAKDVLSGILDLAVSDKLIPTNPCTGVELPRKTRGRHAYLTAEQVDALARAAGEHGLFVRFLALTGLRWGEAIALRGSDLDRRRGRLHVERSVTTVKGGQVEGAPKTGERREVAVPRVLLDALPLVMPSALLFPGRDGGWMTRPHNYNGWFAQAVKVCQAADGSFPRVTPHDLRHTAASLAIQAGAHVKAVQRMLGHASASMTLDQYADLFDSDLDEVAAALDANVGKVWANG